LAEEKTKGGLTLMGNMGIHPIFRKTTRNTGWVPDYFSDYFLLRRRIENERIIKTGN
jgi:hypothetical protein